jgi:hypothetical protein
MNKKILNFVIFLSITGILILTIRDYFLAKKSKNVVKNKNIPTVTQVITPSPTEDKNPKIPCQNKYFNFKKGTFWQYKLISEIEVNKEKQTLDTFFTNKIIEASGSSIIIESQFKGEKEKIVNTLICRKNGVYGFPFPLLPTSVLKNLPLSPMITNFIKPDGPILLLPPEEKLKKEGEWQTVSLANFGISLNNKIVDETNQSVLNLGYINTLTTQSQLRFNSSFFKLADLKTQSFNYQLGENVGFLNLNLNFNLETLGKIKLTLKLIDFKTGP